MQNKPSGDTNTHDPLDPAGNQPEQKPPVPAPQAPVTARDLPIEKLGMRRLIQLEACTRCGECDITCPDYCFVWEKGKDPRTGKEGMILLGIDYQYCKGCLRCTYICKFDALDPAKEAEQDMDKITVKHKFLK